MLCDLCKRLLTDIIGRSKNLSDVGPARNVACDSKVTQLDITVGERTR